MSQRTQQHGLQIATVLHDFIQNEALPDTGVAADKFWAGFAKIVHDLAPKNRALLAERDRLQAEIDAWHKQNPGKFKDLPAYQEFLKKIGYLQEAPASAAINTQNIDEEFTSQAGPQLVVPITNARYALNAANARWGSLYDALYGTDAISEDGGATRAGGYNPVRGGKVIEFARRFLDQSAPLSNGSHAHAARYTVADGKLKVEMQDGSHAALAQPALFLGYRGDASAPEALVFKHNGLHFDVQIDKNSPIGQQDGAGIKDVLMEAALTTIMDCEDSIAAVDAEDKVLAYRNWLGLMNGTLTEEMS